jgi:hypothetical protein
MELIKKRPVVEIIINWVFLLALNMLLMFITGLMTLDSYANLNSKIGGCLLSFFIPYFIATRTRWMSNTERLVKFGIGYFIYVILILINIPFSEVFMTGIGPCLILSMAVLYYGNELTKTRE